MQIEAIDHVNIRTPDVAGTSRFFAAVLGMQIEAAPGIDDASRAVWIYDVGGRAVIHVSGIDIGYSFESSVEPSLAGSGRVHHVALRCTGFNEFTERLDSLGVPYHVNEVAEAHLRQLFVKEPNAILLELNFFAD